MSTAKRAWLGCAHTSGWRHMQTFSGDRSSGPQSKSQTAINEVQEEVTKRCHGQKPAASRPCLSSCRQLVQFASNLIMLPTMSVFAASPHGAGLPRGIGFWRTSIWG